MSGRTKYSVRVVQKHRSQLDPVPWQIIRLNRKNQLTWGVIKFLIAKKMGQFKNKTYTYDIDGIYFDDYANVSRQKFNLDTNKVKKLMSSKEEIEKVKLSDLEGRNKGINGVPFFEINNKTYISGAQSKENLIEAIKVNL